MACHTWFFRRVERTQEEAVRLWIEHQREWIKEWEDLTNNPQDECRQAYPEWTQQYCDWWLEVYKRQLRRVLNGGCQRAIWNKQPDEGVSRYVDGKGFYVADTGYHDIFRKYGYPDNKLFSLQETLDYINNSDNKCVVRGDTVSRLEQFWKEYPDGMIEFG